MRKATLFLFLLLVGASSGLIFWQWDAYSKEIANPEQKILVKQQISAKISNNQVSVEQTLTNLEANKVYQMSIPSNASSVDCILEENTCQGPDNDPTTVQADQTGKLNILLTVPLPTGESSFIMQDWLAALADTEVGETELEITDYRQNAGSWVAGLPPKGSEKLDHIHYYAYQGTDVSLPALYWQPVPLSIVGTTEQRVTMYWEEGKPLALPTLPIFNTLADAQEISVIYTDVAEPARVNGLLLVPANYDEHSLEELLLTSYVTKKASLAADELWMVPLLVSFLTNEPPTHPKAIFMYNELHAKLDEEKRKELSGKLRSIPSINLTQLDSQLSTMLGKEVHFFQDNKQESAPFVPMNFYDQRKVQVAGQEVGLSVLQSGDKQLFPFVATLQALGYQGEVLADGQTVLVSKELSSYRFYVNENIFIYNEEDYGLLEKPLSMIGSTIYIEAAWLRTIFNVEIEESEDVIALQ